MIATDRVFAHAMSNKKSAFGLHSFDILCEKTWSVSTESHIRIEGEEHFRNIAKKCSIDKFLPSSDGSSWSKYRVDR